MVRLAGSRFTGGLVHEEYNAGKVEICPGSAERRATARIPCARPVLLRTVDNREISATCTDLNSTGVGVDTDRVLAVGQRVQLMLDKETSISLLVIYRMGNHYGLTALGSGERLMELLPVQ